MSNLSKSTREAINMARILKGWEPIEDTERIEIHPDPQVSMAARSAARDVAYAIHLLRQGGDLIPKAIYQLEGVLDVLEGLK